MDRPLLRRASRRATRNDVRQEEAKAMPPPRFDTLMATQYAY